VESREGRLSVGVAVAWVNPTAGATLPRLYCTKDESVRSDKGGEAAYPLLFFLCFLHALHEEEDEEKKGRRALSALRARSSCVSRRSALTRFSSSFFTRFSSWARISSFLRSRSSHSLSFSLLRQLAAAVATRQVSPLPGGITTECGIGASDAAPPPGVGGGGGVA